MVSSHIEKVNTGQKMWQGQTAPETSLDLNTEKNTNINVVESEWKNVERRKKTRQRHVGQTYLLFKKKLFLYRGTGDKLGGYSTLQLLHVLSSE